MPAPTELPSNLSTVADVVAAVNDRLRQLNNWLVQAFVENPALADVSLGNNRITDLADPTNDLDAVNLRTLKKQQPVSSVTTTTPQVVRVPVTFGIDDDTIGQNVAGKYGVVWMKGRPETAYISVVERPTTDTVLDLLISKDKGLTWTTVFLSGKKPTFPASAPGFVVNFTGFNSAGWVLGDLLRLDGLTSGGATGLLFVVIYKATS